mmetsp:Transcript_11940/g.13566  ORF Transcript_11940/g.13566 Transcript_11940/m.13566 type:complete len:120 (+) Transcript_11940:201-560(+)
MILDINQSNYYYSQNLFKPENRRQLFSKKTKQEKKRSISVAKSIRQDDLFDVDSKLTDSVLYIKAPISSRCLTVDKEATLKAVFAVLDEFVLYSEAIAEGAPAPYKEVEPKFDYYLLVH